MKKTAAIALITAIFLIAAAGLYLALRELNNRRLKLAEYYQVQAKNVSDLNQELLYLIKADAISPNSQLKYQIGSLFLHLNEPARAESYLKLSGNGDANLLLTEYYILNNPTKAQSYLNKLAQNQKKELQDILKIQTSDPQAEMIIESPATDLGKLVAAINRGELSELGNSTLTANYLDGLPQNENKTTQMFALANNFLSQKQENFAIYTLTTLGKSTGETFLTDEELAKAYAAKNDFKTAVAYIGKTIKLSPENTLFYKEGIVWAKNAGDNAQANFWTERLSELNDLQK